MLQRKLMIIIWWNMHDVDDYYFLLTIKQLVKCYYTEQIHEKLKIHTKFTLKNMSLFYCTITQDPYIASDKKKLWTGIRSFKASTQTFKNDIYTLIYCWVYYILTIFIT